MPIYMDLHIVPGIIAEHVAEAHQEDLRVQSDYGCRVMTYWVDEDRGSAFCLLEAPNKEAVIEMHNSAHGLIPHEIIEVNSATVEAFLGRIKYPENYSVSEETGLKIFNDPAFRIILVIMTTDARVLEHKLGIPTSRETLYDFTRIVKKNIAHNQGRLVEMEGEGFVVSFISGSLAMKCASAIQEELKSIAHYIGLQMSLNAGLPVDESERIFGATIEFARHLCYIADEGQMVVSSIVNELNKSGNQRASSLKNLKQMTVAEEKFLEGVMSTLQENWQNSTFTVDDFGQALGLSKTKFYRKCIALTEKSPNSLIRDYRLQKSLRMLLGDLNIAETTFETGFSSPSYFSKCFQKHFGLLPNQYLKL